MADESAFLRAILANPADDLPRLAYRDHLDGECRWSWESCLSFVLAHPDSDGPRLLAARWLEEQGRGERAEFIRVQCRLAEHEAAVKSRGTELRPVPPMPAGFLLFSRREALRRRERELLRRCYSWPRFGGYAVAPATYDPAIVKLFPPSGGPEIANVAFRRGFVHAVVCTAEGWLAHCDAILAAQPVEEVTLTTWPRWADGLGTEFAGQALSAETWAAHAKARYPRVKTWHLPPAATGIDLLAQQLGVPASAIGTADGANYSSAVTALDRFRRGVISGGDS